MDDTNELHQHAFETATRLAELNYETIDAAPGEALHIHIPGIAASRIPAPSPEVYCFLQAIKDLATDHSHRVQKPVN